MLKSRPRLQFSGFLLIILTCLIFFSGCASIDYKNKHDDKAYNLARQIRNSNKEIKTSKGLGWLKIKETGNTTGMVTDFKIAWVTEPPNKIRMTLLSSGFPVETIVSNGESISLFSHTGKHSLKTYNIKNPSLEDILLIPVKIEDIIILLSGQIPIKDFKYAFFDSQVDNQVDNQTENKIDTNSSSLKTIVLKNKSGNGIQKIYIDSKNQIKKYIITDWKIEPLFEIIFFDPIKINSTIIPSKLIIRDSLNREVSLEISKFYINQPVKKSLFRLTEQR